MNSGVQHTGPDTAELKTPRPPSPSLLCPLAISCSGLFISGGETVLIGGQGSQALGRGALPWFRVLLTTCAFLIPDSSKPAAALCPHAQIRSMSVPTQPPELQWVLIQGILLSEHHPLHWLSWRYLTKQNCNLVGYSGVTSVFFPALPDLRDDLASRQVASLSVTH